MVCRASRGTARGPRRCAAVVRAARETALRALTLYAFSAQNWQRPLEEVATLMQLLRDYVIDERAEIMDNDIRLDRDRRRWTGCRRTRASRSTRWCGTRPATAA